VPSIVGPLRARYVDPSDEALAGFFCGSRHQPERDVNKLVADFHAGRESQCEMRATELAATNELVGICCFRRLLLGRQALPDADWDTVYIAIVGLTQRYQRCRLWDSLLADALCEFKERWGSKQMPAVTALVSPNNKPSWELFKRHGFEEFIEARGKGDAWLRRPLGIEIPDA
jgi:ribosomal protein S18 acetylase RimI-like enzyme